MVNILPMSEAVSSVWLSRRHANQEQHSPNRSDNRSSREVLAMTRHLCDPLKQFPQQGYLCDCAITAQVDMLAITLVMLKFNTVNLQVPGMVP